MRRCWRWIIRSLIKLDTHFPGDAAGISLSNATLQKIAFAASAKLVSLPRIPIAIFEIWSPQVSGGGFWLVKDVDRLKFVVNSTRTEATVRDAND